MANLNRESTSRKKGIAPPPSARILGDKLGEDITVVPIEDFSAKRKTADAAVPETPPDGIGSVPGSAETPPPVDVESSEDDHLYVTLPQHNRASIEVFLQSLNGSADGLGPDGIALLRAAKAYTDIVLAPLDAIPGWCLAEIRKSSFEPIANRYVFVPDLADKSGTTNNTGLFHVGLGHNGETATISKVSQAFHRTFHDAFSITPTETDRAYFVFLKTVAYLLAPEKAEGVRKMEFNDVNFKLLKTMYQQQTGFNPFDGKSRAMEMLSQKVPFAKQEASATPTVDYKRPRPRPRS